MFNKTLLLQSSAQRFFPLTLSVQATIELGGTLRVLDDPYQVSDYWWEGTEIARYELSGTSTLVTIENYSSEYLLYFNTWYSSLMSIKPTGFNDPSINNASISSDWFFKFIENPQTTVTIKFETVP